MKCKINGCPEPIANNSKYCFAHKVEARKHFKEMLTEKSIQKQEQEEKFKLLWKQACEAGTKAVEVANPQMVRAVDMDGNSSPAFPICGFAWVIVRPGNCAFANWLKRNNLGKTNSYSGGVQIWISEFGQSYDMKLAYANGVANVLSNAGIKAYADGRLD